MVIIISYFLQKNKFLLSTTSKSGIEAQLFLLLIHLTTRQLSAYLTSLVKSGKKIFNGAK